MTRQKKKILPLDERTLTDALVDRLKKKFADVIDSIDYPDEWGDTWIYLKTGFCNDPESHIIHESEYGVARMALEGVSECDCKGCVVGLVWEKLGYKTEKIPDWFHQLIDRTADLDIPVDEIVKLARRTKSADPVTRQMIISSSDSSLRRLAAAT